MTEQSAFTQQWIDSVALSTTPGVRLEFRDSMVPGLVLRVGKATKTYYLYVRVKVRGRSIERKLKLGSAGSLGLQAARRIAKKMQADLAPRKRRGSLDFAQLPVSPDDQLLTTAEAATLTRMSKAWFERKRWEGDGPPYYRAGRAVRYLRHELLVWWKGRGGL